MKKPKIYIYTSKALVSLSLAEALQKEFAVTLIPPNGNFRTAGKNIKTSSRNPAILLMEYGFFDFLSDKNKIKPIPGSLLIGLHPYSQPILIRQFFNGGGRGFLTYFSSLKELVACIREVLAGNKYICEDARNVLCDDSIKGSGKEHELNDLTKREIEIIQFVKKGLTSKEIGEELDISAKTVEVHRYKVLKKLGLKNTASLINFSNTNFGFA